MSPYSIEPNEFGMVPFMIDVIKKKPFKFYQPEQLMKHPNIIEAKELLLDRGMADEEFTQFLFGIYFWNQAEKHQKTVDKYESEIESAFEHIYQARKMIQRINAPGTALRLADAAKYSNAKIRRERNNVVVPFFEFGDADLAISNTIHDTLMAIEVYMKSLGVSNFWQLERLREIRPGDERVVIVKGSTTTNTEKKTKVGGVVRSVVNLIIEWVYLHLVIFEERNSKFTVEGDNIIQALIVSALYGKEVPAYRISKAIPEIRRRNYID